MVKQQPENQVRLRKTNLIIIEQPKDALLQQLKANLLHEEHSEYILQHDARYRRYANNLERLVVKEDILTRQYFHETGNVKYHHILLPQHLIQELLQSLLGTAHKHPGIPKMLQEIRQRYYYPSMAKHVKQWVEGCEQCSRDKRLNYLTCQNGTLDLKTLCKSTYYRIFPQVEDTKMLTAIDDFSRYLFAYPLTDASAIHVAKVLIDIMTKHAYLPTTLITE